MKPLSSFQIVSRLGRYIRPRSGLLVLILCLTFLRMGMQLLRPWPLQMAVDGLMSDGKGVPQWWKSWAGAMTPTSVLWILGGALVVVTVLQGLLGLSSLICSAKLGHG